MNTVPLLAAASVLFVCAAAEACPASASRDAQQTWFSACRGLRAASPVVRLEAALQTGSHSGTPWHVVKRKCSTAAPGICTLQAADSGAIQPPIWTPQISPGVCWEELETSAGKPEVQAAAA